MFGRTLTTIIVSSLPVLVPRNGSIRSVIIPLPPRKKVLPLKKVIELIYQFLIAIIQYVPERWRSDPYFWLFWSGVSVLIGFVFTLLFGT